jgi:glycerol kinase
VAAAQHIAAIDQGTASSRCIVFDGMGRITSVAQREHRHLFPRPGWVEHDPDEIWDNVLRVVLDAIAQAGLEVADLVALGITNQRETTILWSRDTGRPVHNAISWQDTRTDHLVASLAGTEGQDRFRERCGLPATTYFSGPKIRWLLDNIPGLRA